MQYPKTLNDWNKELNKIKILKKTYICAPNKIVLIVITTPPTHIKTKTRTKVLDISSVSFEFDKKKLNNKV